MILPVCLLFVALAYLFYISKKELLMDQDVPLSTSKENDESYKDLQDLFI